jgi:lysozyme
MSLRPYLCSNNRLTIGIGHNMEAHPLPFEMQIIVDAGNPITEEMAFELFRDDVMRARMEAEHFDWFHLLSYDRQIVIVCMIFQMGLGGVQEFKKMLAALEQGDHEEAARQMLDSKWARVDSPARAKRMAKMMREG